MLACVSMNPDGEIFVNEGNDAEGNLLAQVPKAVLLCLEIGDESRTFHSYERDSEHVAMLLEWQLESKGWAPVRYSQFLRAVEKLITPGAPFDPADYVITLELA